MCHLYCLYAVVLNMTKKGFECEKVNNQFIMNLADGTQNYGEMLKVVEDSPTT